MPDKRESSRKIRERCDKLIELSKEKYGYASCYYCRLAGRPDRISENAPRNSLEGAQVDHVKAHSKNGASAIDNYALIHGKCNNEKGTMDLGVAIRKTAIRKTASRVW